MTQFNIVHIIRDGILGLRAYHEVIESLEWGLQQLGHDVTSSVNTCRTSATNIILGGHLFPELLIDSPEGTIYYNLEQIRDNPEYGETTAVSTVRFIAANMQIWDYSAANIETWTKLAPNLAARLLPISYAPVLKRIDSAATQDIDILIYGAAGAQRLSVFSLLGRLVNCGVSAVFASGLYGPSRDSLIARSKIVLNINNVRQSRIFEIVRVSYLLANSKAVIADIYPDSFIEQDIVSGIKFSLVENIPEACCHLLNDDAQRAQLERRGFACISQRDIRVYLAAALA